MYFEEHRWIPVSLPGGRFLDQIPVSEFVVNADLIINLPVIKSHKWATYSGCMKNFVGATHSRYRPYMIDSEHWEEVVSEINAAYRPDLNIVDGTKVMYAGGPWRWWSTWRKPSLSPGRSSGKTSTSGRRSGHAASVSSCPCVWETRKRRRIRW